MDKIKDENKPDQAPMQNDNETEQVSGGCPGPWPPPARYRCSKCGCNVEVPVLVCIGSSPSYGSFGRISRYKVYCDKCYYNLPNDQKRFPGSSKKI